MAEQGVAICGPSCNMATEVGKCICGPSCNMLGTSIAEYLWQWDCDEKADELCYKLQLLARTTDNIEKKEKKEADIQKGFELLHEYEIARDSPLRVRHVRKYSATRKIIDFKDQISNDWKLQDNGGKLTHDIQEDEQFHNEQRVGMDKDLEKVKAAMRSQSSVWVGVFGMGGAGKSFVARTICKEFKEAFDFDAWLTLGHKKVVKTPPEYMEELFGQIPERIRKSKVKDDLQTSVPKYNPELMRNILGTSKFLLIIDDVWDDGFLLKLKDFVGGNTQCKILVTSRIYTILNSVASDDQVKSGSTELQALDQQESLELFCRHAFCQPRPNPNVEEYVHRIVKACGGLPLALKVLGRSMSPHRNEVVLWKERANRVEKAKLLDEHDEGSEGRSEFLQRLKLGYDALPSEKYKYRECFLYLALEQQESYLFKRKWWYKYNWGYIWEAEGLIPDRKEATRVFYTLKRFGLLEVENLPQDIDIDHLNYKVHDVLRDLALDIMETEKQGIYQNGRGDTEDLQALATFSRSNRLKKVSVFNSTIGYDAIKGTRHTTALFWEGKVSPSTTFLSSFKKLKVLEIMGTPLEELPKCIGKLTGLVYLDFSSSESLVSVPYSAIAPLIELRHLRFEICPNLKYFPVDALPRLHKLITIRGIGSPWQYQRSYLVSKTLNRGWSNAVLRLDEIGKLAGLSILELTPEANIVVPSSIGQLSQLKVLHLGSSNGYVQIDDLTSPCKNLQHLSLINLKEELRRLVLPPCLRYLRIEMWEQCSNVGAGADGGYNICLPSNNHLETLDLSRCNQLVELTTTSQDKSELLERLWILRCALLQRLPLGDGCGKFEKLTDIHIYGCPMLEQVHIAQCPSLEKVLLCKLNGLKSLWVDMESMPFLWVLSVTDCHSLDSFRPVLSGHQHLKQLEIVGGKGLLGQPPIISLATPNAFPALNLLSCENLGLDSTDTSVPVLESLEIYNSTPRYGNFATFPHIGRLFVRASTMEELDEEWLSSFTNLQDLVLWELPNLARLPGCIANRLPKLERLTIMDCPGLPEHGLPGMDDPESYPSLKHLDVKNAPAAITKNIPQGRLNNIKVNFVDA